MFCPECKRKFREGFYRCANCGADLVSQLPQETSNQARHDEFVEVYSTYHQDDISFLKSILDDEDIAYFFQGESSILLIAA